MLLPSHTMSRGARADLGRLLSMTRNGSRISDRLRLHQSIRATARPTATTRAKLTTVSSSVTPVWRNRLPSAAMPSRHLAIMEGLLKIKLLIQPKSAASSQSANSSTSSMKRTMTTCLRWRISFAINSCWAREGRNSVIFFQLLPYQIEIIGKLRAVAPVQRACTPVRKRDGQNRLHAAGAGG